MKPLARVVLKKLTEKLKSSSSLKTCSQKVWAQQNTRICFHEEVILKHQHTKVQIRGVASQDLQAHTKGKIW